MAFIVESRRGKHHFATYEAACVFCNQVFEKTGVVLSVVQRHGSASPKHFKMLSEFRQGQADKHRREQRAAEARAVALGICPRQGGDYTTADSAP